jgi:NlpC/P60 family putative phage cell wall peptidase
MTIEEIARRAQAVAEACDWIGTPYRHQASAKGNGADCLGLVRGVYRRLCGPETVVLPPYTPDWAERGEGEPLLAAAERHLLPQHWPARPGDVLLFRMVRGGPVKHCGILIAEERFVHAYSGRAVTAAWLSRFWKERLAGAFFFPQEERGNSWHSSS